MIGYSITAEIASNQGEKDMYIRNNRDIKEAYKKTKKEYKAITKVADKDEREKLFREFRDEKHDKFGGRFKAAHDAYYKAADDQGPATGFGITLGAILGMGIASGVGMVAFLPIALTTVGVSAASTFLLRNLTRRYYATRKGMSLRDEKRVLKTARCVDNAARATNKLFDERKAASGKFAAVANNEATSKGAQQAAPTTTQAAANKSAAPSA